MPPTIPVDHYFVSGNQQNRNESPIPLSHANDVQWLKIFACFEHSNLLKVNELELSGKEEKRELLPFFLLFPLNLHPMKGRGECLVKKKNKGWAGRCSPPAKVADQIPLEEERETRE